MLNNLGVFFCCFFLLSAWFIEIKSQKHLKLIKKNESQDKREYLSHMVLGINEKYDTWMLWFSYLNNRVAGRKSCKKIYAENMVSDLRIEHLLENLNQTQQKQDAKCHNLIFKTSESDLTKMIWMKYLYLVANGLPATINRIATYTAETRKSKSVALLLKIFFSYATCNTEQEVNL